MPSVIFSMGLPGAGKSTTLRRLFNPATFTTIDPDEEKRLIPGYNPKEPWLVHEMSKVMADAKEAEAYQNSRSLIIDGTGTHVSHMAAKMARYRLAGYDVQLVYVKVLKSTAIQRNASRERVVPVEIIEEKHREIEFAWTTLATLADVATIIDND
jgi:predicted kinase